MFKHALLASLGAMLIAHSLAFAANDWLIITTAGDPDPVTSFDLANPGASNQNMGFVDGNNNRGMDCDSPTSFYYFKSTDALNQVGDRGLWRWDNGVNTQLYNIAFSDAGDGDATLSNDFTRFFVTVDDQDAIVGDSLYVFENLNGAVTFTEIGETGLTQFIGIAMDPVSGNLYGYDSGSEALYTIDTSNGLPTLVGASGMTFGAIGGMDFSQDGSILLLTVSGDLYTVDKKTGSVTAAGDTLLNPSALTYRVTPVQVPGDITGNGIVDVDDLLAVINAWGACPKPCPPSCPADIAPPGGNCTVDVDDLLMVINNWS